MHITIIVKNNLLVKEERKNKEKKNAIAKSRD
jgi:hypothetical protein